MPSLPPPNTRFTHPELTAGQIIDDGLAAIERHAALAESAADFRCALASGPATTPPPGPRAAAPQITRLPVPTRRCGKRREPAYLPPGAVKDHIRSMLPGPAALVAMLGVGKNAEQSGTKIVMCCPVHADSTPSFGVDVVGGRVVYHCFGCGIGGDVFGLVAIARGLNAKTQFPAVLDAAAKLVGYGSAGDVRAALMYRGGAR